MFFSEEDKLMRGLLCNNVYSLRDLLYVDKNKKGFEQKHAREYYVATVLEEAIKVLTSVIRWEDDFKDGFDKDIENTLVGNLIIQGLYDEINLYYRKLLESLVNLILWLPLSDDKYVEYYYLIKEYNSLRSELSDIKEFYGIRPQRTQNAVSEIGGKIASAFPLIDESKCFFIDLDPSKRPELISGLSVRRIETSVKFRLKKALKTTDTLGKILIGFSYENYSFASQKVHFSTNLDNLSSEIIKPTICFMFAIIGKIIVLCAEWLRIEDLREIEKLNDFLARITDTPDWYTPLLNDIYDIDDYVYTMDGKLGRIINKLTSQYGYRAYHIHFLDGNGADILDDYFPAQHFKRIQPKQELYDMFFQAQPEFKRLYDTNPDEERLKSCLDASMKKLWKSGLKTRFLNKA